MKMGKYLCHFAAHRRVLTCVCKDALQLRNKAWIMKYRKGVRGSSPVERSLSIAKYIQNQTWFILLAITNDFLCCLERDDSRSTV